MLNIITNDKKLDFAVKEALSEIKNSDALCGTFVATKAEKGLSVKKDGVFIFSIIGKFIFPFKAS